MEDLKSENAEVQKQIDILGLALLVLEESYRPADRHLGVVVRNHSTPYLVRTLEGNRMLYAELNGTSPVPEGSLVTVDIRDIRPDANGKVYGRGNIVKTHPYVRLRV